MIAVFNIIVNSYPPLNCAPTNKRISIISKSTKIINCFDSFGCRKRKLFQTFDNVVDRIIGMCRLMKIGSIFLFCLSLTFSRPPIFVCCKPFLSSFVKAIVRRIFGKTAISNPSANLSKIIDLTDNKIVRATIDNLCNTHFINSIKVSTINDTSANIRILVTILKLVHKENLPFN